MRKFADLLPVELIRNKEHDCVPFYVSYLGLEQDPVYNK